MKTLLDTASESRVAVEIALPADQSVQPAFEEWINSLDCGCLYHPDETLERKSSRIENCGQEIDPHKLSEWFKAFRTNPDIPLPSYIKENGNQLYRFRASFHPCGLCVLVRAQVPPLYQKCTFENFVADTAELEYNLAKCREFAAAPHGFLVMLGGVGTGKSRLAAAILRESHRWGSRYFRHSDVVTRLRASYSKAHKSRDEEEDVRDSCYDAHLLVIDEIGVAAGGNDAAVLLNDVLDYRYTHLLPTALCSNLNAEEFKAFMGERLTDRLREAAFAILSFNSPSRRRAENPAYLTRSDRHPF